MEREAANYRQGTLNNFVKVGKRQMSVYEIISMFENQTILNRRNRKLNALFLLKLMGGGRDLWWGTHPLLQRKEREWFRVMSST